MLLQMQKVQRWLDVIDVALWKNIEGRKEKLAVEAIPWSFVFSILFVEK